MNASHSEVVAAINPGETLRLAREAKGLSTAEVARGLNMTESMLRNVEAGAFDKLNGHTFARGYVRVYAKYLGLDQEQLVQAFDRYTGTDATGSEVKTLGRLQEPVRVSHNLMRSLSILVLVGGAGLTYLFWSQKTDDVPVQPVGEIAQVEVEAADGTTEIHVLDEPEDQAVAEASRPAELPAPMEPAAQPETAPVESPAAAPLAQEAPVVAAQAQPSEPAPVAAAAVAPAGAVAQMAPPAAPESAAQPAQSQLQPPAPAAPAVAAEEAALPAGHGRVQVQFTADCWTQLTDADGKVLFSALKRKGESLVLSGKTPIELRLGYARGAQVSLNGQPVDVQPFTSGETARMKLGQ